MRSLLALFIVCMLLAGCNTDDNYRSPEERTLDKRISRRESSGQDASDLKRARAESEIRRELRE